MSDRVPQIEFRPPSALRRAALLLLAPIAIAAAPFLTAQGATEPAYGMAKRNESRPYLGMPAQPVFARPGHWTTEPAFPNVTFRNPVFLEPEPGTRRLLVGELEGRIFALDGADPSAQEKRLVLDLSDHTQGGDDCGLLGLAFHPEYNRADSRNRGLIYVFYSWTDKPIVQGKPPPDTVTWTRLSRFNVDPTTGVANRDSEQVLINQLDRHIWHAGGGLFFHPRDGFLYVSVGDEGGSASPENVQKIDRSLFSGVLRIDVDQRGGDISHPIRTRPASGETAHYFIPNDNPFVGVPGALEEFFAVGLRSPHRMTYDPVDNLAWIGDIGLSSMEEISVLEFDRRPLNFQWDIREGTRAGPGALDRREKPPGFWTDPIFEYGRDQGRSVIGGYVYRGRRHPTLHGKYLFGDFGSGKIWALSYTRGTPPKLAGVELLGATATSGYNYRGGEGGLTSFGRSHDGELYLLLHGLYTRVAQLVASAPQEGNIPRLLSRTGVFDDVKHLVPSAGLVPYDVNLPHWTDGVPARRWISVPTGKQIRFSRDGRWSFPPGTVFVQHFEVPATVAANGQAQRLETRLLVAAADGTYYAVGYRWRPDHSDAEMVVADDPRSFAVKVENDLPRDQEWRYFGPQRCIECHTPGAGYVLGLTTRQLHREFSYPDGITDQQLRTWSHLGLFDPALEEKSLATLSRLAPPDEATASVEHRVRSYLDVNCAHCHGASPVRAAWDGAFSTALADQRIIFGPLVGEHMGPGYHVIAPKDVAGSNLYRRGSSRDPSERMPPIGQSQPDPSFVTLLRRWIEELPRVEREPPQLVRARQRGETAVEVLFSEAVQAGSDATGAERPKNYRLNDGAEVLAARLSDDLRTVTLTTTPLRARHSYTLAVSGVADRAEKPNSIPSDAAIPVLK